MDTEKMLRNNLISAYLDYAREFGEERAVQVFEQTTRFLKEGIWTKRGGPTLQ